MEETEKPYIITIIIIITTTALLGNTITSEPVVYIVVYIAAYLTDHQF
jgi:hypothetical protein